MKKYTGNTDFCRRLYSLMDSNATRQEDIAKVVEVKRQTVGYWCNGKTVPDAVALGKIAQYFNVSADYLLGLTDCPASYQNRSHTKEADPVQDACRRAVATFGEQPQTIVAIEELSELQKEICKYLRGDKKYSLEHISEEMADVEIMLAQLRVIFDNDFIVNKYKREKAERLLRMIDEAVLR